MKLSEDEAKRFLERLCPLQETEQQLLCPRCGRNELYSGLYFFLQPVFDYPDRYLVGDELTFVYIRLCLDPDRCTFFDVFSENVARRYMRHFIPFGKPYGLSAFTRAGRA